MKSTERGDMPQHPIEELIAKADAAINREDFEALMEIYAEDAVLVVQPGRNAVGKAQIRAAFEAIAAHFQGTLEVAQGAMEVLEAGDSALVLARTLVSTHGQPAVERQATYVFRRSRDGGWLCAIDNSYGHDIVEPSARVGHQ